MLKGIIFNKDLVRGIPATASNMGELALAMKNVGNAKMDSFGINTLNASLSSQDAFTTKEDASRAIILSFLVLTNPNLASFQAANSTKKMDVLIVDIPIWKGEESV